MYYNYNTTEENGTRNLHHTNGLHE